jgi:hypothetical protein
MDEEIIKPVLLEILYEIKTIQEEIMHRETYDDELKNKVQLIEKKLVSIRMLSVDTSIMVYEIESYLEKIEKLIKERPKEIIHKRQILLFPEYNPEAYYKLVFGRILFWMLMFLLAYYLFSLGRQFIDNWRDIRQQEIIMKLQDSYKNPELKIHK